MLPPSSLLWLGSVAVSAAFAIVAAQRDDRSGVYLFKPLTTFIILLGAAWLMRPAPLLYRGLVAGGLALSLVGDVFLMLPGDKLRQGLSAFLVAHLAYIAAFSLSNPFALPQLVWLLPFLVFVAAIVAAVWNRLGNLRIPVLIYAAVISVMAWRALMRHEAPVIPRQTAFFGLWGGCLFVVSDAVVALRRFGRGFPGSLQLELVTYWVAQSLIALSVRGIIA